MIIYEAPSDMFLGMSGGIVYENIAGRFEPPLCRPQ